MPMTSGTEGVAEYQHCCTQLALNIGSIWHPSLRTRTEEVTHKVGWKADHIPPPFRDWQVSGWTRRSRRATFT